MPICKACGQDCDESEFTHISPRCKQPAKTCNTCIRLAHAGYAKAYRERNKDVINARLRAKYAAERGYFSDSLRSVRNKTEEDLRHDLLRLIDQRGAISPPALAAHLNVTRQTAAARIRVLLGMGLVKHHGHEIAYICMSKTYALTMPLEDALKVKRNYSKARADKEQASAPPSAAVSLQSVWR